MELAKSYTRSNVHPTSNNPRNFLFLFLQHVQNHKPFVLTLYFNRPLKNWQLTFPNCFSPIYFPWWCNFLLTIYGWVTANSLKLTGHWLLSLITFWIVRSPERDRARFKEKRVQKKLMPLKTNKNFCRRSNSSSIGWLQKDCLWLIVNGLFCLKSSYCWQVSTPTSFLPNSRNQFIKTRKDRIRLTANLILNPESGLIVRWNELKDHFQNLKFKQNISHQRAGDFGQQSRNLGFGFHSFNNSIMNVIRLSGFHFRQFLFLK